MENRDKLFIVSFGDSRKYRVYSTEKINATVTDAESLLKNMLSADFKELSGKKFYTTPEIVEISKDEEGKYAGWPELTADVVRTEIEPLLRTEAEDADDLCMLNRNAPFDDIDNDQ